MDSQSSSHSPNEFDFILKEQPKPKHKLGLPANLPKPVIFILAGAILIFLIIVISSLFLNRGSVSTDKLYGLISDSDKIAQVSDSAASDAKDPDVRNLAATAQAVLSSQNQQFSSYLTERKIKLDKKKISTDTSDIEAQLKTAAANNNYDATFLNYLKSTLTSYHQSLNDIYNSAGPNLKPILSEGYVSIATVLQSPELGP